MTLAEYRRYLGRIGRNSEHQEILLECFQLWLDIHPGREAQENVPMSDQEKADYTKFTARYLAMKLNPEEYHETP